MAFNKKNLLLLFHHPREPVFMPKGPNAAIFDVPEEYLTDRYKTIGKQISHNYIESNQPLIPVKKIPPPSLEGILELPRDDGFSLFIPKHREISNKLIEIFMSQKDPEDLLSVAVYARDRVNTYMFIYALSLAILHRKDTQDLNLPSFINIMPEKFIDPKSLAKVREEASVVPKDLRISIDITMNFTATDLDEEHRLAYFREDLGVNSHHWHWHLVYPHSAPRKSMVDKNRRGELFYYMHQQIIARYNFERFCNNLPRTRRLRFDKVMNEAYFPKLYSPAASRVYPGRGTHHTLEDVNRDGIDLTVDDLESWAYRIQDAIDQRKVTDEKGKTIILNDNILGNIVESSILTPNANFYGDLHNMGHVFISCVHDPDKRYLENFGVMSETATAMRDPTFYRWHRFIDGIFQRHKATLVPYSEDQLNFAGVTVTKIEVESAKKPPNTLHTFWQKSETDVAGGLDFFSKGSVYVKFIHLQHEPFTYKITVNNASKEKKKGTCRIFLAPKYDEQHLQWSFVHQRTMFIELDKFTVDLTPDENFITRLSTQSSVTIPDDQIFPPKGSSSDGDPYCGCGWPQHMLIPKGTQGGKSSQLFVMISDYEGDKVEEIKKTCADGVSYCGLKDQLYPDRRAMGYPFDRLPRGGVETLDHFLTPNMKVQDVDIVFNDVTVEHK